MLPEFARSNPNYFVEIKKRTTPGSTGLAGGLGEQAAGWSSVMGTLPEELAMQVSSQFEAKAANFLANQFGGISDAITLMRSVTGASPYLQGLTQQMWVDSEPFELNLTLNFDAETDAYKDVMEPTTRLMSWVLPTATTGFMLQSPAPTVYDPELNRIVVHIGRSIMLPSVIIPTVSVTHSGLPDKNGNFIRATAEVTIRTILTPHAGDLLSFFGNGSGQGMRDTGIPAGSLTGQMLRDEFRRLGNDALSGITSMLGL